ENRQNKQKAYYDQIKDPKLKTQMLTSLLFEADRKKLYESLSPRERAELENNASDKQKEAIKKYRAELPEEDRKKTNEELARILKDKVKFKLDDDGNITSNLETITDQLIKFTNL